jgi:hypothetical protein
MEAAYQLMKSGFKVKGLILIDSPYPTNHKPLPEAVIRYVLKSSNARTSSNTTLIRQFKHAASLLARYSPPRDLPGIKTVILHSQDVLDTKRCCGVEYEWLSNQAIRQKTLFQWSKLVGGNFKTITIPGNHFEPFDKNNVRILIVWTHSNVIRLLQLRRGSKRLVSGLKLSKSIV